MKNSTGKVMESGWGWQYAGRMFSKEEQKSSDRPPTQGHIFLFIVNKMSEGDVSD